MSETIQRNWESQDAFADTLRRETVLLRTLQSEVRQQEPSGLSQKDPQQNKVLSVPSL